MSDQPIAQATTYTTHNKHKRQTAMPSVAFEPLIQAIQHLQAHALDSMPLESA
jgi:hypothetical protein